MCAGLPTAEGGSRWVCAGGCTTKARIRQGGSRTHTETSQTYSESAGKLSGYPQPVGAVQPGVVKTLKAKMADILLR